MMAKSRDLKRPAKEPDRVYRLAQIQEYDRDGVDVPDGTAQKWRSELDPENETVG
jgi:hypothetical protein